MATQPTSRIEKILDKYDAGPTLGTLRIGSVTPFGCSPEEEAPRVLEEAYALLSFMSASYQTNQDLCNRGEQESTLALLSEELKAGALDAVGRLVSLSLHMLEAGREARMLEGTL